MDAALGAGDADEQLVEFENIPVTRGDMRTLRHQVWLNDEVSTVPLYLATIISPPCFPTVSRTRLAV